MTPLRLQIPVTASPTQTRWGRSLTTIALLAPCIGLFSCGPAKPVSDEKAKENTTVVKKESESLVDPGSVEVTENDVSFVSRGVTLHGSIFRPQTSDANVGVLIVHDWGPWGRDGTVQESFGLKLPVEVPIYRSIAESLAENGFLTVSYDKRSCVSGSMPWCTYDRSYVEKEKSNLAQAFVDDAKAALDMLAKQDGVDPNRLLVISHGHGAEIAMELSSDPRVKGIALLVPNAEPPDKVAEYQTEQSIAWIDRELSSGKETRMKDLLKQEKKKLKKTLKAQKKTFAALRNGNISEMAFGLPGTSWQQFFKSHDTFMETLKTSTVPSVVVTGGQVSSERPTEGTFGALAESNPALSHIHVEGLCQLLVQPTSDKPSVVSDAVIEAILSVTITE